MCKRNIILIVDDVEINRAILCEAFCCDYNILEAENGRQAVDIIDSSYDRIAAVLLDIQMPVMNGFSVLEYMKTKGYLESIPVFLITADDSEESMLKGFSLGVMDIIGKPFITYFLQRRVNSVVELYRTREQLAEVVKLQEKALEEKASEIQSLNNSIIVSLSAAIEFRDCESGEHVQRIHDLTRLLLTNMKEEGYSGCDFTDEQIEQIATAAIMHDVGKIAIPDSILNKPGKLTYEEFELMKTHTVVGCELLNRIPNSTDTAMYEYAFDICRHHHEKWDGKGYPDGLKGDEISIWSQVVSIADCYDALRSERVYKPAYTHEEAMKMILNGECGQFNPNLLSSFKSQQEKIRQFYLTK